MGDTARQAAQQVVAAMTQGVQEYEWLRDTARQTAQQLVAVLGCMLAGPACYSMRCVRKSQPCGLSLQCLDARVVLACFAHGDHTLRDCCQRHHAHAT